MNYSWTLLLSNQTVLQSIIQETKVKYKLEKVPDTKFVPIKM